MNLPITTSVIINYDIFKSQFPFIQQHLQIIEIFSKETQKYYQLENYQSAKIDNKIQLTFEHHNNDFNSDLFITNFKNFITDLKEQKECSHHFISSWHTNNFKKPVQHKP